VKKPENERGDEMRGGGRGVDVSFVFLTFSLVILRLDFDAILILAEQEESSEVRTRAAMQISKCASSGKIVLGDVYT